MRFLMSLRNEIFHLYFKRYEIVHFNTLPMSCHAGFQCHAGFAIQRNPMCGTVGR